MQSAVVLAVRLAACALLHYHPFYRFQVGDLDGFVTRRQRLEIVAAIAEHQLTEDVLILMTCEYKRAVIHHPRGVNDDNAAILEFRCHAVADDVQGFELQALAGCEDVLERFAWVYVECSFMELYAGQAFADAVIAWLRERGLRLAGVYNMAYDGEGHAVQADFLFGR